MGSAPVRALSRAQTAVNYPAGKCVFCGFIGEASKRAQSVYQDGLVLAMLDDFPIADGHLLVILKTHRRDVASLTTDEAACLGKTVARLARALKDALHVDRIYVASVGEQVQHVHYHLIPRYETDRKGFVHFLSARGHLADADRQADIIRKKLSALPD